MTSGPLEPEHATLDTGSERRSHWLDALVLLALALAVRWFLLTRVGDLAVVGDEKYYWGWLEDYRKGNLDSIALRPPLWGALVAWCRATFGEPFAARALAVVLAGCATPFVYRIAARELGRRTGLLAGLLFALYPENVGFSHYLWAENLVVFLFVVAADLLLGGLRSDRTSGVLAAALLLGVALLAKAFAVVAFIALVITLWWGPARCKLRTSVLALLLFALPATIYSSVLSPSVGRRVVVSETGLASMRQVVGLEDRGRVHHDPATADAKAEELWRRLRNRPLSRAYRDAKAQLYFLWSPNTWVSTRLLRPEMKSWRYGIERERALFYVKVLTLSYVLAVVLGLAGLCLGETGRFGVLGCLLLLGITLLGSFAAMATRYRLPFFFVLLIGAAQALSHPVLVFGRIVEPRRLVPLVLLLALFAHVVLTRYPFIGLWG
jgi:hypothetical protein